MISSNITTSYTTTSQHLGTGLKTSPANAALFQSMLQSKSLALRDSANTAFGIGSVGTKTIIASPFQMNTPTLANKPMTDVSAPAAVSGENMQMSDYLDIYKSIYDKYAAIYGDGFEFTPCYSAAGNKESEAREQKIQQMLKDFDSELAANIPGEFLFRGSATSDSIDKMFYEEKYNLKGLSPQEQIDTMMARFGNGTLKDLNTGIGVLYQVGAITGDEFVSATSKAISHIREEEFGKALNTYNYSSFEDFYKQYWANIILHIDNMLSAEYDWADVFKNQSSGPYANKVAKLFG